jgi:hypothetical protein
MGRRHPAVRRQANPAEMVPVPAGQSHILFNRRVSNIDHGVRSRLKQDVAIAARPWHFIGDREIGNAPA